MARKPYGDGILLPASVAGEAPLRIPAGTAPSSPGDGDFWITNTEGLSLRVNGQTMQIAGIVISSSAPSVPFTGLLWFDTVTGGMFIRNSSAWVDVGGGSIIDDSAASSSKVFSSNKMVATFAPIASPTFTGKVTLPTGASGGAPLKFTAGTVATSLVNGDMEYDGDRLTFTKSTNAGRSLIQARQMLLASGNSAAATTNTPVSPFGTSNDTLTLEANKIYRFKGRYFFTPTFTSGTPNIQIGFTFSQTVQSIKYRFLSQVQTPARVVLASTRQGIVTSVSATQVTDTISASTNWYVDFEGYFTSNASTGGTILPFFQMSTTGVSTVCSQYSSFEIEKLGPAATVVVAGAWA